MNRRKNFSLITLGITTISAQVLFSRELFVVFYGNELSFGLILGIWLLATAIGSLLFGKFTDRIKNKVRFFGVGQLFMAILLPADLLLIRLSREIGSIPVGEIVGISHIFFISMLILFPFCLLSGFLFVLGCKMLEQDVEKQSLALGYTYILEAIGSSIGGVLFGYLLIEWLKPFQIILTLSWLNLFSLTYLRFGSTQKKFIRFLRIIFGLAILFTFIAKPLERWSINQFWKPFDLLEFENTKYGNIVAIEQNEQTMIYENGLFVASEEDIAAAEEIAHFPLLHHPNPKNVLLIGGGTGGAIAEILKYSSVEKLIYAELDPQLIQISKTYIDINSVDDSRLNIHFVDGRRYLLQTDSKFHAIIVNLPDPLTAQINRFYTVEFFSIAKSQLTDDGILCFNSSSAENFISDEMRNYLASLYYSAKEVFPEILIISGDTSYFIAKTNSYSASSSATKPEKVSYEKLLARLDERDIDTQFVNEYYLPYRLSPERLGKFQEQLEQAKNVRLNRDLSPISYYYDIIIWSSVVKSIWEDILKSLIWLDLKSIVIIFVLISLCAFVFGKIRKISKNIRVMIPIAFSIFTTGFAEISFQIIVILAFQIFFGYVYFKLGLIYTAFMVGLALGSYFSTKKLSKLEKDTRIYKIVQFLICLYPIILIGVFHILKDQTSVFLEYSFPLFSFIPGFMGGIQFPLGSKIVLEKTKNLSGTASILYSADLLGAFIGALLISLIFIPLVGIYNTCIAVTVLNLGALAVLFGE